MIQFLIAVDQVINTLVWADKEGFGKADETLSARAWRLRGRDKTWGRFQRFVDQLFFWQRDPDGTLHHCRESYISEITKKHLPETYRAYVALLNK